MPVATAAQLPLFTGATSLVVAATFLVLWRHQRSPHLLSFGVSFTCIGLVLASVAVQQTFGPMPARRLAADALFIGSATALLAGALAHTGRTVPWWPLSGGGAALWVAAQVIDFGVGIPGVVYLPFLGGVSYAVAAWLFWSRRGEVGHPALAALLGARALLHVPWPLAFGTPVAGLIRGTDQLLVVTIGLALIVTELLGARTRVEAANARLRSQARVLEALNEQLRIERQIAVSASNAKSAFLANMSHELRTPLNAVIGFSEIISSRHLGTAIERYADYGRDIRRAAGQLLRFIEQILELSRIEAGGIDLERGPVNPDALVNSAVVDARHRMGDDRGRVVVTVAPETGAIDGDERYLRQLLIGLLVRAMNESEPEGQVRIGVVAAPDDAVRITVADDGAGLSPAELAVAFEPFAFAGAAFARPESAIDLTLPVARRLVQAHGGSITVDSTAGRGTTVSIDLPRAAVA